MGKEDDEEIAGVKKKVAANRRQLDMLHGSIWDKIPRFALPVAATAILEQMFNASDVAVVGNFTGAGRTAAVAAVGANGPVIGLLVNLFIGIALGANVVIANAIGRNDRKSIQRAVHTSIVVAVLGGALMTVLGELTAEPLLRLLQVPEDVFPLALLYLRIYLLGMPVILLYNFEAAIFRSVGETKVTLLALIFSGILNVMLNLFFVVGLNLTVNGVAIATVVSNAVSSLLLYCRLRSTELDIHVEPRLLRIDFVSLRKILRIGLPAGLQGAVFSLSNIVIQFAVNSLGTVVMAASSAALNIEIITYDILCAFNQACTTFTSQNYGAGNLRRCRRTLFITIAEAAGTLTVAVAAVLFFGRPLLAIFNSDPAVVDIGYIRLMTVIPAHFFSMLYEIQSGYLRGFGISLVPSCLTIAGVCGIRMAWIQWVFPLNPTFQTIMNVYPISLSATALLIFAALLWCRPSRRFG